MPCGARSARSLETRRRACDPVAVRNVLCAEYLARSGRRHRDDGRKSNLVGAVTKGISPAGYALLSGVSLHVLSACQVEDVRDLFAYLKTLDAGVRQGARPRCAFSFQHPAQHRDLEIAVHGSASPSCRIRRARRVESRRLSGQQPRPLCRVSQPAEFPRRHHRRAAFRRRPQSGRGGMGTEHHPKRNRGVERKGHRLFPRNRGDAGWRHGRRLDGAGDQEHLAIEFSGSRRHGRILKSLPPVEGPPRPRQATHGGN